MDRKLFSARKLTRKIQITDEVIGSVKQDFPQRVITSCNAKIDSSSFLVKIDKTVMYFNFSQIKLTSKIIRAVSMKVVISSLTRSVFAFNVVRNGAYLLRFVIFEDVTNSYAEKLHRSTSCNLNYDAS